MKKKKEKCKTYVSKMDNTSNHKKSIDDILRINTEEINSEIESFVDKEASDPPSLIMKRLIFAALSAIGNEMSPNEAFTVTKIINGYQLGELTDMFTVEPGGEEEHKSGMNEGRQIDRMETNTRQIDRRVRLDDKIEETEQEKAKRQLAWSIKNAIGFYVVDRIKDQSSIFLRFWKKIEEERPKLNKITDELKSIVGTNADAADFVDRSDAFSVENRYIDAPPIYGFAKLYEVPGFNDFMQYYQEVSKDFTENEASDYYFTKFQDRFMDDFNRIVDEVKEDVAYIKQKYEEIQALIVEGERLISTVETPPPPVQQDTIRGVRASPPRSRYTHHVEEEHVEQPQSYVPSGQSTGGESLLRSRDQSPSSPPHGRYGRYNLGDEIKPN